MSYYTSNVYLRHFVFTLLTSQSNVSVICTLTKIIRFEVKFDSKFKAKITKRSKIETKLLFELLSPQCIS